MNNTKFTHRTASGRPCRIISTQKGRAIIEYGDQARWSYPVSRLTTITKEA